MQRAQEALKFITWLRNDDAGWYDNHHDLTKPCSNTQNLSLVLCQSKRPGLSLSAEILTLTLPNTHGTPRSQSWSNAGWAFSAHFRLVSRFDFSIDVVLTSRVICFFMIRFFKVEDYWYYLHRKHDSEYLTLFQWLCKYYNILNPILYIHICVYMWCGHMYLCVWTYVIGWKYTCM